MTLAEAQALRAEVAAAYSACLKNQSYTIKDRSFTRADLKTLSDDLKYYDKVIASLESSGTMRVRQVLPRDN